MPFIRYTRDKRGYETTYVVHGYRPTQGTGEIQIVDGKYRAFGNELTIDPGRFVFGGGAIDNPGLDVRAYRGLTAQQNVMTGSGEIVGVNLRGTLRRPASNRCLPSATSTDHPAR